VRARRLIAALALFPLLGALPGGADATMSNVALNGPITANGTFTNQPATTVVDGTFVTEMSPASAGC
jgi:hypothetical protein